MSQTRAVSGEDGQFQLMPCFGHFCSCQSDISSDNFLVVLSPDRGPYNIVDLEPVNKARMVKPARRTASLGDFSGTGWLNCNTGSAVWHRMGWLFMIASPVPPAGQTWSWEPAWMNVGQPTRPAGFMFEVPQHYLFMLPLKNLWDYSRFLV